jgi:hypothetical protein
MATSRTKGRQRNAKEQSWAIACDAGRWGVGIKRHDGTMVGLVSRFRKEAYRTRSQICASMPGNRFKCARFVVAIVTVSPGWPASAA